MSWLARVCVRHRWIVVALWVAAGLYTTVIAHRVGSEYSNSFDLPNTDTQRAIDLLRADFPQAAGDVDQVVVRVSHGKVTDPGPRRAEEALFNRVAAIPHVVGVISPLGPGGAAQISKDGRIAYAVVQFDHLADVLPQSTITRFIDVAKAANTKDLQVELEGQAIELQQTVKTGPSELAGVLASAIVLFLAFGSWRGMVTPLVAAIAAILVGTSIEAMLSHALSVAPFAQQLSVLMGLGVGVDYALFIVSRHRNNLLHGMSVEESIEASINTSGRAVLFAGATVCVALLGLLLLNITFLVGVAVGTAITVALTMLASLTLTPALLGFMGMKVLGRRRLRRLQEQGPDDSHVTGGWLTWARTVERHRLPLAVVAIGVIVALGAPAFAMRLGAADAGNDPANQTTRKAYDLLSEGFGAGFNGNMQVVVQLKRRGGAGDLAALQAAIREQPDVAQVSPAILGVNRQTAVFVVVPKSSPQDQATTDLVKRLRNTIIPRALPGSPVKLAYVGGSTGAIIDFSNVLARKLPLFIGVVVLAAALLLMIAFRSLVIPLTASVMNIFAAVASFGVLVFVFQDGHLANIFTIGRPGPVDAFVPVMMFAILFGLSMDYQVFLVSRMHEEWIHTGDNRLAVRVGQAETGRVITAAASIMIAVFLAFVFGDQRQVSEFGLGLAGAVLIDAFVLRTVLVPAIMHTLGNANWFLPRWMDRTLPHLSIEPPDRTYDDDLTLADFEPHDAK
ncbi:MAG TPA: MMPL family transporter [Mycobacteriales bacterium]|jgi:RND superfamily putative drug exporter|nr:MMPL family transporter [Mycobacteriales bacterium]